MSNIESRVKKVTAERLSIDEGDITIESHFIDDLGADSLDIVELVMAFEEEFDQEIPDEDAEDLVTVRKAVEYITEHG